MTWPGHPSDPTGHLVIGPDADPGVGGAPYVRVRGVIVGVYLDDTTPHLDEWIRAAAETYPAPEGLVIVMISMSHPHWRHGPIPPVLNVHEYYPINSGQPIANWPDSGFPPGREGYCGQHSYPGYATEEGGRPHPPDNLQREKIKRKCLAQHPRLYLEF